MKINPILKICIVVGCISHAHGWSCIPGGDSHGPYREFCKILYLEWTVPGLGPALTYTDCNGQKKSDVSIFSTGDNCVLGGTEIQLGPQGTTVNYLKAMVPEEGYGISVKCTGINKCFVTPAPLGPAHRIKPLKPAK